MKKMNYLSQSIIDALEKQNIVTPTKIQEMAISQIIDGKDVMIKSQTGSGKTLAYLLPLYQTITEKGNQVVIICPTRELCMQVHGVVKDFSALSSINLESAVVFGGVNIKTQIEKLKSKPQIIIGTVDRVLELVKKKKIQAHLIKTFIIDEADKLEHAHIKTLRKCFMRDTQVVFVSATFSKQNIKQIQEISPNINFLETSTNETIPENITHLFIIAEKRDKLEVLRKLIGIIQPVKSLIFINDLNEINTAVAKLNYHNINCVSIHSETSKESRQKGLKKLENGDLKYLVSTDLASRGLHINNIDFVYHMSISEDPSDYLHRAGRTGRNDKKGVSICIATENEIQYIKKYKARFKIEFSEIRMKYGEITYIDDNKIVKVT